jgi:hypothetical protein
VGLIRLLDFALLSFLVWFVWSQLLRGWRAASAAERSGAPPAGKAPPPYAREGAADATAVTLERCSVCGVHVPSGRTLPGRGGEVFCSDACRVRGPARPS